MTIERQRTAKILRILRREEKRNHVHKINATFSLSNDVVLVGVVDIVAILPSRRPFYVVANSCC